MSVDAELINKLSGELCKQCLKIATAESCTGGLLAHLLTSVSGSSNYFEYGIISYSNQSKIDLLQVPKITLEKYGAVSEETAQAMAEGIRKNAHVDIGVSTTGIAGPTGGTKEKPIGLVYIGISTKKKTNVYKFIFTGDRLNNKEETCNQAFKLLLTLIQHG